MALPRSLHADFGQVLVEQAQGQNDVRRVSSVGLAMPVQPKFGSDTVPRPEQSSVAQSGLEANSLTMPVQAQQNGYALLQSPKEVDISAAQVGSRESSSSKMNKSEVTGNLGGVKAKERESEGQAAQRSLSVVADAAPTARVPVEESSASAIVPPQLTTDALAKPKIMANLQLPSRNLDGNVVGDTNGLGAESGARAATEEVAYSGSNSSRSKEILINATAAIRGSGAALTAVQMLPGSAAIDIPKGGGKPGEQAELNSTVGSPASGFSGVQMAAQAVRAETRTGSSVGAHAAQNEHTIPVPAVFASSSEAPLTSPLNGMHAVGTSETAAPPGLSRAQHVVEVSGSTTVNPYQRLDQGTAPPAAVINSSANRVAVGLHDPALGWVEIKTQSTAGQVSAALLTASSQTHESLAAQLPSLAQFLADREVRVGSLTVEQQPPGGNVESQASSGGRQDSNAQQEGGGTDAGFNPNSALTTNGLGADEVFDERPLSYISVRA